MSSPLLDLLASALIALSYALPIAGPLAALVLAATARGRVVVGATLLLGLGLGAGAASLVLAADLRLVEVLLPLAWVVQLLGSACALAAAVLLLRRPEGTAVGTALGAVGAPLIGLGLPVDLASAGWGITDAAGIVVLSAVGASCALVLLTAATAALALRWRPAAVGVAVATCVVVPLIAVILLVALGHQVLHLGLPHLPGWTLLLLEPVVFAAATAVSAARGRTRGERIPARA